MHEKYKTKEQHLKENDERNFTIIQKAKSKTLDLMTTLFSFDLLVLAMLGYMNKVSLLVPRAIYNMPSLL